MTGETTGRTKPGRIRCERHLQFVRGMRCMICRAPGPSESHHLLRVPDEPHGMGIRTGDDWAVPLCSKHHRILHQSGDETGFFKEWVADQLAEARLMCRISPSRKVKKDINHADDKI